MITMAKIMMKMIMVIIKIILTFKKGIMVLTIMTQLMKVIVTFACTPCIPVLYTNIEGIIHDVILMI